MTHAVFRDDAFAKSCNARVTSSDADGIVLDRTVFYPLGGGQPGDTGFLRTQIGVDIPIVDTRHGSGGVVLHIPAEKSALPLADCPVALNQLGSLNPLSRRLLHCRFHNRRRRQGHPMEKSSCLRFARHQQRPLG